MAMTSDRQATPKQLDFIRRLMAERGSGVVASADALANLTMSEARRTIDDLLAQPLRSTVDLTEGMYRTDNGTIYKVQRGKQSGKLYAKKLTPIGGKRLTELDGAVVQWEFVYAPGALAILLPDERMTMEQAQAFGLKYGVCCVCGTPLKDARSVRDGIGPVCRKRV